MSATSRKRRKIILATSGLGTNHGGIGVVSQMLFTALSAFGDVSTLVQHVQLPRPLRKTCFIAEAVLAQTTHADFVLYEHVHLAAAHLAIPTMRRIPFGVFLHGVEVWEPLAGLRREALTTASILISNSDTTIVWARRPNPWLGEVKITWLGVRVPQRHVPPAGLRPPVALIVSRIAPRERAKGHDEVLSAWPLVRRAVPEARLAILGDGADRVRLERRVAQERIEGVQFLGQLTDLQRDLAYRTSRAFLLPSRQEGFGLATVEAAGWGLPVLALRNTVVDELFPEGAGATLAPDTAPDVLAEHMIPLFDPARASALGHAAHQRVNEVFREEHFIERFSNVMAPLLG